MTRPRSAAEILLVMLANGVAGLLVFTTTVLRETPQFWHNSGGYPVFLRNLVYFAHYPLLVLVLGGTAAGTLLAFRLFARHRGMGGGLLLLSALQWLLFLLILVIMLWNNVDNLLHGRPLHYHPSF
jgi:hypothetical protein